MSANKRSDTERAEGPRRSKLPAAASDGKTRKQRSGDLGRALRSVYDDTLRETVPDDFSDLLGKLA